MKFDVYFSLNGCMKIVADTAGDAMDKVEQILLEEQAGVGCLVKTGVGIEVYDAVEEAGL